MLFDYLIFLAKVLTIVIAILVIVAGIIALSGKNKEKVKEKLVVKKLNDKYKEMSKTLRQAISTKSAIKQWMKSEKKSAKLKKKQGGDELQRKRIFVVNFSGDIKASAVRMLREEVTALLTLAKPSDEVIVRLKSMGGLVNTYGLAASQLQRLRQALIPLTVIIDEVAASGGYMMACVGNKILAAPFSIIGSIGVVAQLPNFHRLLKKNDVDYELITAGEYKRTLTVFGENTRKGRHKMQDEVNEAHQLFKNFIRENRPILDVEKIATGEHWFGIDALNLKLIDAISTSDSYLLEASDTTDIYELNYVIKKSVMYKFCHSAKMGMYRAFEVFLRTNKKWLH